MANNGISTNTGDMITSTYYYKAYPEWVSNWNAQRKAFLWRKYFNN